jgi:hypothetical protein
MRALWLTGKGSATSDVNRESRKETYAAILIASVILSVAAIYNQYPLVWPDTGGYIHFTNLIFRTPFYSLLLYPIHLTWSLWPVVFFQSVMVAHIIYLVLRTTFGSAGALRLLLTVLILGVFSSLPWITGLIMPDVFTSVLVLAVFLLAFRAQQLSRIEQAYLYVMVVLSVIVHLSHAPLAVAQILFIVIFGIVFRKSENLRVREWWVLFFPVLLSLSMLIGNNLVKYGSFQLSPGGYCFQLARLVADGPARAYLEKQCPQSKYALCEYLQELPKSSGKFLWDRTSPFKKVGGFYGYWKEAREIVLGTVKEYPIWVFQDALRNLCIQLTKFRTGKGLIPYVGAEHPTLDIRKFFPNEFHAYANSKQNRGVLNFRPLNLLHVSSVFMAAVFAGFGFYLYAKAGQWSQATLLIFIIFSIIINSLIAGAGSKPEDRYLSRLIWLVPFFGFSCLWDFFRQRIVKEEV